jgi:ribosomal protein L29
MADTFTKKKTEELTKELQSLRKKLQEFRFAVSGAAAKNSKEARDIKKNIARILTELTARQKQENK